MVVKNYFAGAGDKVHVCFSGLGGNRTANFFSLPGSTLALI
jgi:hypothetical protein